MNNALTFQRRVTVMLLLLIAASLFTSNSMAQQTPTKQAGSSAVSTAPAALPSFSDYPAGPMFTGTPAPVNLASDPNAQYVRSQLTEGVADGRRFAGHYRIVEFGCGTACQSVWAVDLVDGRVFNLFTASSGVAFRPNSRLIVENDPSFFLDMLKTKLVAEVEAYMKTYGAPKFWVENKGKFERVGPDNLRIDPVSKKFAPAVTAATAPAPAASAQKNPVRLDKVSIHLFLENSGTLSEDVTSASDFSTWNSTPLGTMFSPADRFNVFLIKVWLSSDREISQPGEVGKVFVKSEKTNKMYFEAPIKQIYIPKDGRTVVPFLYAGYRCEPLVVEVRSSPKSIVKTLPFKCGE
ncbi:MAG: hypothetical protein EXR70_20435 [Deltaproteobacteria bacterium]|nr:hypothetical protein [Deltaproteobacteria bacterium]